MTRQRVLAIGLDGLEITLAERFMAQGQMPALADLKKRAARFLLDEGRAQRTGLPWEHVASGLSPEVGGRWSPIEFDSASYTAWQDGAHFAPWWGNSRLRVVVFDSPFVDLRRAGNTKGIVAWGAHNPGTVVAARPAALLPDFLRRFGDYPADDWTYGTPWPSAAHARRMGEALSHAVKVRSRATQWLATERFPEWDLFFTVASELHSGVEGLWHGVDADHPLNAHHSAAAAGDALLDIHRALDQMIGQLARSFPDATIIAFNMGGMGPNRCDIQSMVLLPELLYRNAFCHALMTLPEAWTAAPDQLPPLDCDSNWSMLGLSWVPEPPRPESEAEPEPVGPLRAMARHLPEPVKVLLKGAMSAAAGLSSRRVTPQRQELDYIPAYRYRHYWPQMPAFAIPSYLDGCIRINLRGREQHGIVEPSQYDETCRKIETLLRECRDPRTGEPMVAAIERTSASNPLTLPSSDSDLLVVWRGVAAALEHPRLGLIGPVPLRRTGGHTHHGFAYLAAPGLEPGDRGVRSSFDVVPTIVQLLDAEPPTRLAGKSLLGAPA